MTPIEQELKRLAELEKAASPNEVAERTRAYVKLQYEVHKKKPDAYGDYYCGFEDGFKFAAIRNAAPGLIEGLRVAVEALERFAEWETPTETVEGIATEAISQISKALLKGGDK